MAQKSDGAESGITEKWQPKKVAAWGAGGVEAAISKKYAS